MPDPHFLPNELRSAFSDYADIQNSEPVTSNLYEIQQTCGGMFVFVPRPRC